MVNIQLITKDYLIIAGWTVVFTALIIAATFLADYNNLLQLEGQLLQQNIRNDILIPALLGLLNFSVLFWKIRQLSEAKKILEKMASTDSLTGLLNRRALQRRIEEALAAAGPNLCALMIIDIDHFKKVNDTYGHEIGDHTLIAVTSAIERSLQNGEIFGRIGGEEFLIFMPNITPAMATLAAERFRLIVETNPFCLSHLEEPLTVSIGVSVSTGSPDFVNLYRVADARLYQAKNLGRNRVVSSTTGEYRSHAENTANTNMSETKAHSLMR